MNKLDFSTLTPITVKYAGEIKYVLLGEYLASLAESSPDTIVNIPNQKVGTPHWSTHSYLIQTDKATALSIITALLELTFSNIAKPAFHKKNHNTLLRSVHQMLREVFWDGQLIKYGTATKPIAFTLQDVFGQLKPLLGQLKAINFDLYTDLVLEEFECVFENSVDVSFHTLIAQYQTFLALGLTKEELIDHALRFDLVDFLRIGLTDSAFLKNISEPVDYGEEAIKFLRENNLLKHKPIIEWQSAIYELAETFTPTYIPTKNELEDIILLAAKTKHIHAFNSWLCPYIPHKLTGTAQAALWAEFTNQVNKCKQPEQMHSIWQPILRNFDWTVTQIKQQLALLSKKVKPQHINSFLANILFLSIGHTRMLTYVPKEQYKKIIDHFVQVNKEVEVYNMDKRTLIVLAEAIRQPNFPIQDIAPAFNSYADQYEQCTNISQWELPHRQIHQAFLERTAPKKRKKHE